MNDKIKISNVQFMITTSGFVFGSSPLFLSSGTAIIAGRDAWISAIFATILGLLSVWINIYLRELYPDKTLIEVFSLLLGKWLGNILSIIYVFTALLTGTQIIWYVGDLITTTYTPEISAYPTNILFVVALVIALLYGLEAMYRAVTIYFYGLFPLYLFTLILVTPNIDIKNHPPGQ
ncbi:GerAB/ArcD/ProY family transporter [Ruminiclostridium papyrosolvens]|uniref:GerAB/ArcD/ProY family transporter n=1 Tax=Ruminiclostridium papyrosolvens TaxID=29362 RepID=UPI0004010505|nr:GerAB/ArcD/ProY family transporter [Ruminiclostridium papyrosolvens]